MAALGRAARHRDGITFPAAEGKPQLTPRPGRGPASSTKMSTKTKPPPAGTKVTTAMVQSWAKMVAGTVNAGNTEAELAFRIAALVNAEWDSEKLEGLKHIKKSVLQWDQYQV